MGFPVTSEMAARIFNVRRKTACTPTQLDLKGKEGSELTSTTTDTNKVHVIKRKNIRLKEEGKLEFHAPSNDRSVLQKDVDHPDEKHRQLVDVNKNSSGHQVEI